MFFLCGKYNIFRKGKSSLPTNKILMVKQLNKRKQMLKIEKMLLICRERTSLSASLRASMTVETACVLPIFIFGMLGMMYFFLLISGVTQLGAVLQESGENMAVYAYAMEGIESKTGKLAGGVMSIAHTQAKVNKQIKELSEVHLLYSKIMDEDEMIDLVAAYKMKVRMPFYPWLQMSGLTRARVRAWTGRKGSDNAHDTEKEGNKVFVTETGKVYHKNRECTHLRLSIHSLSSGELEKARNESGGKYYPCEMCSGKGSSYYITDTGNRYHTTLSCSGLKRSVTSMSADEVKGWRPCARCGQ